MPELPRTPYLAVGTRGHPKVIHSAGTQACLVQAPTEHPQQLLLLYLRPEYWGDWGALV